MKIITRDELRNVPMGTVFCKIAEDSDYLEYDEHIKEEVEYRPEFEGGLYIRVEDPTEMGGFCAMNIFPDVRTKYGHSLNREKERTTYHTYQDSFFDNFPLDEVRIAVFSQLEVANMIKLLTSAFTNGETDSVGRCVFKNHFVEYED